MITAADIRPVDLFDDLSDDELEPWAASAFLAHFGAGDTIIEMGQDPRGLLLLLEGTSQAFMATSEDAFEPGQINHAPTWIGAIAALTGTGIGVRMVATTPTRFAVIPAERFVELTMANRSVFSRVMAAVPPVLGRIAAREQERERLASLGTMSAGLAHELNNPAAAAKRSAAELQTALETLATTMSAFIEAGVSREDAETVVGLMTGALEQAKARGPLAALDAADAEDELLDTLEDLGVRDPYRYTEALTAAGVDRAWLESVAEPAKGAFEAALAWVAASLEARQLVSELREATHRMSSLVGAIKSYSYMDRGELNDIDVREGIETTLTILGHKLKHTAITVERDYAPDLPRVTGSGSALNQVWTNLLDNAIDALGERGVISITARPDAGCVRVDIADDAPEAIPDDVIERIFDPFFTTKEVGQGTGMGLDTARQVVVNQHRGSLTVESVPGRTVFSVWLPA